MGDQEHNTISYSDAYIFVDESGSITKNIKGDKFFIICLIITKDKDKLNRVCNCSEPLMGSD